MAKLTKKEKKEMEKEAFNAIYLALKSEGVSLFDVSLQIRSALVNCYIAGISRGLNLLKKWEKTLK